IFSDQWRRQQPDERPSVTYSSQRKLQIALQRTGHCLSNSRLLIRSPTHSALTALAAVRARRGPRLQRGLCQGRVPRMLTAERLLSGRLWASPLAYRQGHVPEWRR
ncbi:hypothetical protein KUCAC02_003772, partial [Chaenocephalus aceratus]